MLRPLGAPLPDWAALGSGATYDERSSTSNRCCLSYLSSAGGLSPPMSVARSSRLARSWDQLPVRRSSVSVFGIQWRGLEPAELLTSCEKKNLQEGIETSCGSHRFALLLDLCCLFCGNTTCFTRICCFVNPMSMASSGDIRAPRLRLDQHGRLINWACVCARCLVGRLAAHQYPPSSPSRSCAQEEQSWPTNSAPRLAHPPHSRDCRADAGLCV